MRRSLALVALVSTLAAGCGRAPTVVVAPTPAPPPPPPPVAEGPPVAATPPVAVPAVELTAQERYDAALWRALERLAEHKLPEALAALEEAQRAQDTAQVRREIARLKLRRDARTAAERTTADIRAVLQGGRPDEAARLAADALAHYGDGESAALLTNLKRQADALVAASLDRQAQLARFRQEADAAARDNNLRAAAVAYDQALALGDDAELRRQADELRGRINRYDDARRRAAALRRDAAHLEDALAALRDAAGAWDTLEVRQEIDDCTLALQSRRDRLAIADFETRGDVGLPLAGKTIAEELVPAFKGRFDLVERDQLGRVLDELRLSGTDLAASEDGRREFARVANVRYLVVGSVTPLSGITVHARLVDVRTGLVVQTARVSAPTPDGLMPLVPQLAAMLQMNDEQRLDYEARLARQTAPPPAVVEVPTLPPPPVYAPQAPPPPPVLAPLRPADLGGVAFDDFGRLPPIAAPGGTSVAVGLTLDANHRARPRALAVAVELGDNLFRRGRFREAQAQFQLALGLSPDQSDILVRLERCNAHLPPAPAPVVLPRPRIAVLDFVAVGDAAVVPPGLGAWTAEHLAPYLSPPYEVADRGEVSWSMGRLGLTLRDAVIDPLARLYLGRVLHTRHLVLGTLRGTPGGLIVDAHLLDCETGARIGTAEARVASRHELKLRLGELAHWLRLDPFERARVQAEADQAQALLARAQQQASQSNFAVAIDLVNQAGKLRPGSVQVEVFLSQFDRRRQQAELEARRQAEWQRQQAAAAEAQRRQQELARAAEAARIAAAQQAAAAERQRQQERAYSQLLAQARAARDARDFARAVQLYDAALGLQRHADVVQELTLARAAADEQVRARAAEDAAARERDLRQQREGELVRLREQVERDRRRRAIQDLAIDRDASRLLDEARQHQASGDFDRAVRAAQASKQLRPTAAADTLLTALLVEQARAAARRQGDRARDDLDAKLAAERAGRVKAEAESAENRRLYEQAVRLAELAMQQRNYAQAETHYAAALKVQRTDAALSGLKLAQDGRAREQAKADTERKRQESERHKAADIARLLKAGNDALAAGKPDEAANAFQQLAQLAPGHAEARAGLAKAEQLRLDRLAAERKRQEAIADDGKAQRLIDAARKHLQAKQYGAAVFALEEALKAKPNDSTALALMKQARDASTAEVAARAKGNPDAKPGVDPAKAAAAAAAQKTRAEFDRLLQAGRTALDARRFDEAVQSFTAATRLIPADVEAARLLTQAREAQQMALADKTKADADARRRQEEQKRRDDFARHMTAGKAALAAMRFPEAQRAFADALKLQPNDAEATRLLKQAQDAAKAPPEPQPPAPVAPPKVPPKAPPPTTKPTAYTQQMQSGAALEKDEKYAEAAKAYQEALKAVPNDPAASKRADYAQRMDAGLKLLKAQKKAEAAREFEAALKAAPGDAAATRALGQARRR